MQRNIKCIDLSDCCDTTALSYETVYLKNFIFTGFRVIEIPSFQNVELSKCLAIGTLMLSRCQIISVEL